MTPISKLLTGTIFKHDGGTWIIRGEAFRNGSTDQVRACMNCEDQSLRPFNISIEVEDKGPSMKVDYFQANPINSLK